MIKHNDTKKIKETLEALTLLADFNWMDANLGLHLTQTHKWIEVLENEEYAHQELDKMATICDEMAYALEASEDRNPYKHLDIHAAVMDVEGICDILMTECKALRANDESY